MLRQKSGMRTLICPCTPLNSWKLHDFHLVIDSKSFKLLQSGFALEQYVDPFLSIFLSI